MNAPHTPPQVDPEVLQLALETVFASVTILRAERDGSGQIIDFRLEYTNNQARDVGGREMAPLIGSSMFDLYPGLGRSGLFDSYVAVVETGEPLSLEATPYHDRLEGRSVWGLFDMRASAKGDLLVLVALDVTERQEQMHALDNAKRLARIGIWTWDATSNALWWSPEMYQVFGMSTDDEVNVGTLEARTHPDDLETARQSVADAVGRGEPFLLEQRVIHADGTERVALVSGGAVRGLDGEILAIVGTSQDITELRSLELELVSTREQLLEQTLEAERRDRRRLEDARRDAEQRYGDLVRQLGRSVLLARVTSEISDLLADLGEDSGPVFERVTQLVAGALDGFATIGIATDLREGFVPVAFADASGPRPDMLAALDGAHFPSNMGTETGSDRAPMTAHGDELFALIPPDLHPVVDRYRIRSAAVVPLESHGVGLGVIAVGRQTDDVFDESDLGFLRDLGDRCALALSNWRLQRARERAALGLASLQAVTDATVEELGVDALLDELLVRLRDALGVDTVRILLTDDGQTLRGGAQLGFGEAESDTPVPLGQGVAGHIALSREPVVHEDLSKVEIVSPVLRNRGLTALAGVSLWAGDTLVGVLHVGSEQARYFDAWDLELLARAGERIGAAIERNRLYERELMARERLEFVASVNEVLGGSLDRRQIMREVVRVTVPRLGDWCSIHVLPEENGSGRAAFGAVPEVEIAHNDPARVELARDLQRRYPFDPSAPLGVPAVIRTGRPQLFTEFPYDELERLAPGDERLQALRELQVHSVMIVPLVARGRTMGAMQFVHAESGQSYDADDLGLAMSIAGRVGAALENVRLYETQRHIARTLQASLLPSSIPEIPGAAVAVRYWAAGEATEVGGDFYDLFTRPDGRIGIVIGDVCGKGPQAAAVTGLVRHTLRGAARHEDDPATVMRWANESIIETGQDLFCTAVYGVLRPQGRGLDLSLAVSGHPLPVVVDAAGRAREVGRHGNPLGAFDRIRATTENHSLEPGDTMVLYTDGITDVPPPHDLDAEGMRGLLADAIVGADSAEEVADRIFDTVQQIKPLDRRDDDIAVLVVRLDPDGASSPIADDVDDAAPRADSNELHLDLTGATALDASEARHQVSAWLTARAVPLAIVNELAIVTSELLSNALRASDGHDTQFRMVVGSAGVEVTVTNRAEGVSTLQPGLPDPEASTGRGLFVVATLVDDLSIDVNANQVEVRATKSW